MTPDTRLVRRPTYAERLEAQVQGVNATRGVALADIITLARGIDMNYRLSYISNYAEFAFSDGSTCSFEPPEA